VGRKDRVHTSGAYPTYDGKCHDDETGRLSFQMGKHLDKYGKPWASCIRISSDPWCTGETIGLDVVANGKVSITRARNETENIDQCYNIPERLGDKGFAMTSFRLELVSGLHSRNNNILTRQGPCPGGEGPKFDTLDQKTCRWGTNPRL
jgi:hypothetical protein